MKQIFTMTKRLFQNEIRKQFPDGVFSYSHFNEMLDGVVSRMTLYYINGKHVASWQSGRGCIL